MNISEAYAILELSPSSSPEDTKKRYKELTKKYHPDINKDIGAEDKFKKINEAYSCVSSGKETNKHEHNPFGDGFQNPFGGAQASFQAENISLHETISFKESILGCQRDLNFTRNGKCQNCNGQGQSRLNNGCTKCGGRGQIVERQSNMIFSRTCDKCMGQSQVESCKVCSSKGHVETKISINVNIPGGVTNNNTLRLNGFGNYVGNFIGMDQYTEAYLNLSVTPEEGLVLEGNDVVSHISISLLEALCGTSKITKTIMGDKNIIIPELSKNKDEIKIPNLGVNGVGSQRVIINVEYPKDINHLINLLNDKEVLKKVDEEL